MLLCAFSERNIFSMLYQQLLARFRVTSLLRLTLLHMGLLDELITGFVVVGLPLLRDQLGLTYAQVGLLFSAGALSAMILEPIINLMSDRSSKRWWILGGLLILAADFALAGNVRSFGWLLFVFILMYPAIAKGVVLAEGPLFHRAQEVGACRRTPWTCVKMTGLVT